MIGGGGRALVTACLAALALGCALERRPDFCREDGDCVDGRVCTAGHCRAPSEEGLDAAFPEAATGRDAVEIDSPARDAATAPDVATAPDIAPAPDATASPDRAAATDGPCPAGTLGCRAMCAPLEGACVAILRNIGEVCPPGADRFCSAAPDRFACPLARKKHVPANNPLDLRARCEPEFARLKAEVCGLHNATGTTVHLAVHSYQSDGALGTAVGVRDEPCCPAGGLLCHGTCQPLEGICLVDVLSHVPECTLESMRFCTALPDRPDCNLVMRKVRVPSNDIDRLPALCASKFPALKAEVCALWPTPGARVGLTVHNYKPDGSYNDSRTLAVENCP